MKLILIAGVWINMFRITAILPSDKNAETVCPVKTNYEVHLMNPERVLCVSEKEAFKIIKRTNHE